MKRISTIIGLLFVTGVLFWFFPLFYVVPANSLQAVERRGELNAAESVASFWKERLVPSLDQAPDVATVLAAFDENYAQARQQYGRSVGLGRAALYFVRGTGTIVSVSDRGIGVSVRRGDDQPDILLQTGLVSGNTVRDATGLLNASDYPNSQEFNDISTELNRIVESTVISKLRHSAKVGEQLEFVGCAKVLNLPRDVKPLKIIPLEVRFE